MSEPIELWHNPRCSKSRETKALLEARGVSFSLRLYLEDPPSRDELSAVIAALGGAARSLLREKEALAKELELRHATDAAILDALVAHPVLIERPVVRVSGQARIGRPPENVLELLG